MIETTTWGGPRELSAWEALMWRSESDPRTRSTGVVLEILDGEPDWDRLLVAHERLARTVPRLRERVVRPPVPLGQPVWSADPHFDLSRHVQRMALPSPGSDAQLMELCGAIHRQPLDPTRPPWESLLVTGLSEGRSAILFKVHHSLSDGLGLMQLLALAHSRTARPSTSLPRQAAVCEPVTTPSRLLAERVKERVGGLPRRAVRGVRGAATLAQQMAESPAGTLGDGVGFARSLGRMLAPPSFPRSPLLANNQIGSRLVTHELPLAELKAAGKAAGSSLNDAYVAAVLGALRRFHEVHDAMVELIPIGMPVSLRTSDVPQGGNRFAGARLAAPLAEPDPAARMRIIRQAVDAARRERALGFLDHLSPVLTKLPTAAIVELSASLTTAVDLNISNIRGSDSPLYVAGCQVLDIYPLGPRPGVALMVAMVTYDGKCCIGLNVDAKVFPDDGLLEQCLREGFDEVLALAVEDVAVDAIEVEGA